MNSKLLIYLFVFIFLISCTSKPLVGKWKLDDINIEKAVSDFPENEKENMRVMLKTALSNMKNKFFVEFSEDGKYVIEAADETGKLQKKTGTWELSSDNKKLKTITDGREETVEVIEISNDKLVLNMNSPSQSAFEMTFIHR